MNAVQLDSPPNVTGVTHPPGQVVASALVVDDSQLCRDIVCKTLNGNGFTLATACDGLEGIAQLKQRSFDIVLLDNDMPKMNGLAFLKALRAETRWDRVKVVMLTTNASKEVIVEALRYRICDYLLKEKFSMPQMLARIRGALARADSPHPAAATPQPSSPPSAPKKKEPAIAEMSVPNLVPRDTALAAIVDMPTLKTLAGIVSQLATIAASGRPSIGEVTAVVRQDPILAARVMQLAVSGGSKARVASIEEAVRIVGASAVGELAAKIATFNAYPADHADGLNLLRCWQHAFAVAAVMKRIVPKSDTIPAGLPYLVGLCHDLTEICLRQKFPSEFGAAIDYSKQGNVPAWNLVNGVFGATYAELTDAIITKLGLNALVADPILEFIKQPSSAVSGYQSLLARSLVISNFMAHGMILATSAESEVAPLLLVDCSAALIPTAAINAPEIRSESITMACVLANVGPEAEGPLMAPLLPAREVSIFYVRHSSFAPLDPLEAALKNLAKCVTREHLPKHDELSETDGMVIVSPASDTTMVSEALRLRRSVKNSFPILHLSPGMEDGQERSAVSGIEETSCPISLGRLAEFISKLKPARK